MLGSFQDSWFGKHLRRVGEGESLLAELADKTALLNDHLQRLGGTERQGHGHTVFRRWAAAARAARQRAGFLGLLSELDREQIRLMQDHIVVLRAIDFD